MLAQAGQAKGVVALKNMCADSTLERYWRVKAALDLLDMQDQSGLNAVTDVLHAEARGARVTFDLTFALSTVSRFRNLSADDSRKLVTATADSLTHPDVNVRIAAGHALAGLGDPFALPYLQNAVASESDRAAAAQLQVSVERLQQVKK